MKKNMRRWEAVLICMALLFSLFSLHTAEAKDEETLKTIFPVHVIHKTGDDKENFVIVHLSQTRHSKLSFSYFYW